VRLLLADRPDDRQFAELAIWWGSSDLFDFTAARNVLARPANSSFIILTEVKASALVSSHKRHGHRGEHQLNVIEVMMTRVR